MSTVEELRRLNKMRREGRLSEADFADARAALMTEVQDAEITASIDANNATDESDMSKLITRALGGAAGAALASWLLGAPPMFAGVVGIVALGGITWALYAGLGPEDPA